MARYAERTEVSSDKSRAEIENILRRYGATAFGYGWDEAGAVVMFQVGDRRVRFQLPLPDRNAHEFTHTPTRNYPRDPAAQEAEYERAVRQRWRAVCLVIKAKLEAVEAGISTLENEFLAHIILPGSGATVGEWIRPQLAIAYERQEMPALISSITS
jgi:hypothetical protein